MSKGFDTPDQLTEVVVTAALAAGYVAVGRYISGGGSWKHLTQAEVDVCRAHGMKLWLIDEGSGDAAQFEAGQDAGHQAGMKASQIAEQLGVPSLTPIFVGVDYGAGPEDMPAITAYMAGYKAGVVPYKAGMYADGAIASAVPSDCGDFVPGASGWPGTKDYLQSGACALVQHPPVKLFGLDVDPVDILDESVLWSPGSGAQTGTTSGAVPPVSPGAAPVSLSVDRRIALRALQSQWGLTGDDVDGLWGPVTAAAAAAYYANREG